MQLGVEPPLLETFFFFFFSVDVPAALKTPGANSANYLLKYDIPLQLLLLILPSLAQNRYEYKRQNRVI